MAPKAFVAALVHNATPVIVEDSVFAKTWPAMHWRLSTLSDLFPAPTAKCYRDEYVYSVDKTVLQQHTKNLSEHRIESLDTPTDYGYSQV